MGQRTRYGKATRRRRSPVWWWVLGVGVVVLAGATATAYRSRPRAATGPYETAVSEIEHVHGLAVDPANPRILWIGTHGSLIRVTDGKQWIRVGRQGYDMMGFNVHPAKVNALLTSGHPGAGDRRPNPLGVEVSEDGGQTWRPVGMAGQADFHTITVSRVDPNVVYAWNVSGRAGFYRSRDGGRRWDYLGDRGLDRVFSLAAHPARSTVVFAATAGGLFVSEDGGDSWRPLSPLLFGLPVTTVEAYPKDPRVMYAYAARPDLGLIRSADGGKGWASLGFFLGDRDAIGNLALDPTDARVLYFATFGGAVYQSTDGGKTRQQWVSHGQIVAGK